MLRGRQLELDRAAASLAGLTRTAATATAVVVDGDAGMGKSALLDAIVAAATGEAGETGGGGATVLRGRGHALGATVAYGPVAGALARHLHRLDDAERQRLVAGLGSLALLVEGIGEPPPAGDPELERARMFQAVALLLSRLAVAGPVVVCIDDLHWADLASVELLEHLVAELRAEAVGFVVAIRPIELADRTEIRHLVAELLRLRAATRLTVGPLDEAAVAAVVADRVGGEPAPGFAGELLDLTGGMALAVDALLGDALATGALVETGAGWGATAPLSVPGYVVDLFAQRLEGISAAARSVVTAIAVADEPLPATDLAALLGSGSSIEDAERAAAEGAAAGLLTATEPSTWEASHALVAAAAGDALGDPGRQALHVALAGLPRLAGDAALDQRARHLVAAGRAVDDVEAAEVLARAGRRARSRGAAEIAARWFTEAAGRLAAAGRPAIEVARLHGEAGDAWDLRGNAASALAARSAQADLLDPVDPAGAARAATAAATDSWLLGRADADDWWARAWASAVEADPVVRLRTRQGQFNALMRQGRVAEAGALADQVRLALLEVEAASPLTPEGELAAALARHRLLVYECFMTGQPVEQLVDEAPDLPPDTPLASVVEVEGVVLDALTLLGRFDEARRRAEALLRRLGPHPPTAMSWRPVTTLVTAHLAAGTWDDALDLLTELPGDDPVVRSGRSFWAGTLALRRGDPDGARAAADTGRPGADARTLANRRHVLDAVTAYADLLAGEPPSVDVATESTAYFALAHGVWSGLAGEVLAHQGRRPELRSLTDALRTRARPGSYPHALADRLDALGAGDAAGLAAAAEALDHLDVPFEAAVARLEAAELDRSTVPPAVLARDAERFERLGAAPWSARARALGASSASAAARRRALVPELTRREREVAELVAEGLTNGQVAERLGVSIRTVTSHLDHAYTKLGIGSRAALVAHILRLPAPT